MMQVYRVTMRDGTALTMLSTGGATRDEAQAIADSKFGADRVASVAPANDEKEQHHGNE
jgi:hypothetical protein